MGFIMYTNATMATKKKLLKESNICDMIPAVLSETRPKKNRYVKSIILNMEKDTCGAVSGDPHGLSPVSRLLDYKACPNKSSQEERRKEFLLRQKRNRHECHNLNRSLEEETETLVPPLNMKWLPSQKKKILMYKDHLMLSEWLQDVPSDLKENWCFVPCPQGKRSLIVATRGYTKSYSKSGHLMCTFSSALPGGGRGCESYKPYTVLDCLWNKDKATYYILDVMTWNNHPLLHCDTDFRFYWLKSKLSEVPEVVTKTVSNPCSFSLLPRYPCDPETLLSVMAVFPIFVDNMPQLDGVLFYHRQTHYTFGPTPLVGWLKPYMFPDLFKIPVAEEYLGELLEAEQCMEVSQDKCRKVKRKKKKNHVPTKMETAECPT